MIELRYDGSICLSTGRSRKETHWKNRETTWAQFVNRVSETHRTAETLSEYMSSKKMRQDEIKDIGGYVGGYTSQGKRRNGSILNRQLVTLDLDHLTAEDDPWGAFTMLFDCAACMYTTHKHSALMPRIRMVLPLNREVTTDEYVAIARYVAGALNVNLFDDTTFEPARLMYWPSSSKDAEFLFNYQDGEWLDADEVLGHYRNWHDASEWPVSDRIEVSMHREMKKQEDPLEKRGVVGAFCRAYSIPEAIATFLSEEYEECDIDNRYTYLKGSTSAGLVVYDDKFAYSHHGTDPTSGQLCNAFDLVRVHKFALRDEDAKEGLPTNRLPSYLAMTDFASKDGTVRKQLAQERISEIHADFDYLLGDEEGLDDSKEQEPEDLSWTEKLDADRKGDFKPTIDNIKLILTYDQGLKDKFGYDDFERREVLLASLPWRKYTKQSKYIVDSDEMHLYHYIESRYGIYSQQKTQCAWDISIKAHRFNPLVDFLKSLTWDGEERLETLLINYLGCEDSAYVRAVTRKTLTAAVTRAFHPGVKFDYTLVLVGEQGLMKSTLVRKLGMDWYSDSFSTVLGKEAFEQIQGVWIMELGELAGLKKAEVNAIKHFMSKQDDRYRVAYGKRVECFPRQCIFVGTTNDYDFLQDPTGNRRFWPVDIGAAEDRDNWLDVFNDLTDYEISQIWAEAVSLYNAGEPLYLTRESEKLAREQQLSHTEEDERKGAIERFLNIPITSDWKEKDIYERRNYYAMAEEIADKGETERTRISVIEIWCECFGGRVEELQKWKAKEIKNLLSAIPNWKASKAPVKIANYGTQRVFYKTVPKGLEKHSSTTSEMALEFNEII